MTEAAAPAGAPGPVDPLALLVRGDKWYLGGAKSLLWAPVFPTFLETPGFWDEAHYLEWPVPRLFTLTLLDQDLAPVPLTAAGRSWRPDSLTQRFSAADLSVVERKVCLPDDVLAASYTIQNDGERERTLHAVIWSIQATDRTAGIDYLDPPTWREERLVYTRHLRRQSRSGLGPPIAFTVALGLDAAVVSHAAQLSEVNGRLPRWEQTPFDEQMRLRRGRLSDTLALSGVAIPEWGIGPEDGDVYLALHTTLTVPAGQTVVLSAGAAVARQEEAALGNLAAALAAPGPMALAEAAWRDYLAGVPSFTASDPFFETAYWYRWYGLRLNRLDNDEWNAPYPAVCEGIGMFRNIISYSAQCHMRECRWMHDPAVAQGSLLNFVHNQLPSGFLPGHIYSNRRLDNSMYHANWGASLLAVAAVHTDDANHFLARVYEPLARYRDYFARERDRENSHLYDVIDQNETGQEYMSRYLAVDEQADQWGELRLKGVDSTVYLYELEGALAWAADRLGRADEAVRWRAEAKATGTTLLRSMWQADASRFADLDPRTMTPTAAKAAVHFYPFFTDVVGAEHLPAIYQHLLDPEQFWTPWPLPSSSVDDPFFSAEPEWKGKRHSCPWNGRVWPMTNSHIAEALVGASRLDPALREVAAEFIRRFVLLLFTDQDPARPNCWEHYHPYLGTGSAFRGIDDYQHSWVVDLIIGYLCGIQPHPDGRLVIDPLPFAVERFAIRDVRVQGHIIDITWAADTGPESFRVVVDGQVVLAAPERQRLELALD